MTWPSPGRPKSALSKDRRTLTVTFDNGESHALPAEYLRVFSPSAEVQGHSPEQRVTVGGKEAVEILKVEPVGNYAVRLHFDDLPQYRHLFAGAIFCKLGQEHAVAMGRLSRELAAQRACSRSRSAAADRVGIGAKRPALLRQPRSRSRAAQFRTTTFVPTFTCS